MGDFSSFLRQRVGHKRAPFYLHWISSYHRFRRTVKECDGAANNHDPDGIGAFGAWLGHRYEDCRYGRPKKPRVFSCTTTGHKAKGAAVTVRALRDGKQKSPCRGSAIAEQALCNEKTPKHGRKVDTEVIRLLRLRHLSCWTEKTCLGWIRRFGFFVEHKSPENVMEVEVKDFLTQPAIEKRVSASTQKQAFNARPG